MSGEEIADVNIPMGVPLVYELDEGMNAVGHYYLCDERLSGFQQIRVRQISDGLN
jgi:hypothetical protein